MIHPPLSPTILASSLLFSGVARLKCGDFSCVRRIVALVLLLAGLSSLPAQAQDAGDDGSQLFRRENLVAWCIVPFDDRERTPQQRAEMLRRLGITKYAYDYRPKHIPTFDAEMEAIKDHGIELTAWWFPSDLNDEARLILDVLRRHGIRTQLWVTGGGEPTSSPEEQQSRVEAEAARIRRIAEAAGEIGCRVSLYNHGGWFGQPENQLQIIRRLDLPNVGIVYNLHHGHEHLDRLPELLQMMLPHLDCLNLNGMVKDGDRRGKKILPIGEGDRDLEVLTVIRDSGYRGPIGILNHTQEDAEARLRKNIEGLKSLTDRLDVTATADGQMPANSNGDGDSGCDAADDAASADGESQEGDGEQREGDVSELGRLDVSAFSLDTVRRVLDIARTHGDAQRGLAVFTSAASACVNCHRIGEHGGKVGPDLTALARLRIPEEIVEAVYWPQRTIPPQYVARAVLMSDGQVIRGYAVSESESTLEIRDPTSDRIHELATDEIEDDRPVGSLMPDGLTSTMTPQGQADLIMLLLSLGREGQPSAADVQSAVERARAHAHGPASFPLDPRPLRSEHWPNHAADVNRDRIYDFYAKQARYFLEHDPAPPLLQQFPGLDGPDHGHWGNQTEETWADDRWSRSDFGSLQAGVFRGDDLTVPRGVCVRVGDEGELSVCFDPESLTYPAAWTGGFVKVSAVRSGLMHGLTMDGRRQTIEQGDPPRPGARYRGFYRHGKRVGFVYRDGQVDYLDVPTAEQGRFRRWVAPLGQHPLRKMAEGGPAQWPEEIECEIAHGDESLAYAIDTIGLPPANPWGALMYVGGLAFDDDGAAYICTIHGDVWRATGFEYPSTRVRWKRFASGLHQPLGVVIDDDGIFVLGRDQITRLRDLNGNGEADFYECYSSAMKTSASGHDYICGLERDAEGYFYTASGNQGLLRITPDGSRAEVLATGLRNPDGLGLYPDGAVTVPSSEGNWVPASMVALVQPGGRPHFGYPGPRDDEPPDLPMVYLPRALDNSGGGQVFVSGESWGPLRGQMLHLSYGGASHFLLLRDEVDGVPQGAVVPLVGDFLSGVHRGRFRRQDGQLYVAGAAGWGTYAVADGCFQRVRYTGAEVRLPIGVRAHENGIRVTFSEPLPREAATDAARHFAQTWNYRYGPGYGSPEFSTVHPATPGHDPLPITSAHLDASGTNLFLEIPELQPANQVHLDLQTAVDERSELFVTVHRLAEPFTDFPGYRRTVKEVRPHPILADVMLATRAIPNPWRKEIDGAREIQIRCQSNLTYDTTRVHARPGEPLRLTLINPDAVPHNWALIRPGTLDQVGGMTNRYIADPEAPLRHYVPDVPEVLVYTDIVEPGGSFSIDFHAPDRPGRYPYLCTFPGHWSVMHGELVVEP